MTTPGTAPQPRARRRRTDPIAAVVAGVAVGILLAGLHHVRAGMLVAAVALGAAALLRLVLTPHAAGSLVVRSRRIDVVVLAGLAAGLAVLAAVTPFPSAVG